MMLRRRGVPLVVVLGCMMKVSTGVSSSWFDVFDGFDDFIIIGRQWS